MRRRAATLFCLVLAAGAAAGPAAARTAQDGAVRAARDAAQDGAVRTARGGAQEIVHSRYAVFDADGRIGTTDVTEFRRADGSRSILVRERLENYGPVLDRFLVVTFDEAGHFRNGHWVATSEFSPRFTYSFEFNGRVVRGEWEDANRGRGRVDVPADAGDPVFTFWGYPESLILTSFDGAGPDLQHVDAVAVEDNLHMRMTVAIERLGPAPTDVPAGRFEDAVRYRVERFGDTHHWIDANGTLLRWLAEDGTTRWELERYPAASRHASGGETVASGQYEVSYVAGGEAGSLDWRFERSDDGGLLLDAEERFGGRTMQFRGTLDPQLNWTGSSHTVDWHSPPDGVPEVQHFETFFFRGRFHLLRFRDRAYHYLQSRDVRDGPLFHLIHVPAAATAWLHSVPQVPGSVHRFDELAILGNFYWGASAEIQPAEAEYLGRETITGPDGPVAAHRYRLGYQGGWHDSELHFWTDEHLIPLRVDVSGFLQYVLTGYTVADPAPLRPTR